MQRVKEGLEIAGKMLEHGKQAKEHADRIAHHAGEIGKKDKPWLEKTEDIAGLLAVAAGAILLGKEIYDTHFRRDKAPDKEEK